MYHYYATTYNCFLRFSHATLKSLVMKLVTLSSPRDKPQERLRSKRVQQIIISNETDQLNRATLIFQKSKLLLQGNLIKLI